MCAAATTQTVTATTAEPVAAPQAHRANAVVPGWATGGELVLFYLDRIASLDELSTPHRPVADYFRTRWCTTLDQSPCRINDANVAVASGSL